MTDISERVTIDLGGREIKPVSIAVKASLEDAARTCEFVLACRRTEARGWYDLMKSGPVMTVTGRMGENGASARLFTGHGERIAGSVQAEEGLLRIAGRSKTGDLVDSAAEHKGGREFKGKKPDEVAKDLAAEYSVEIEVEIDGKSREVFRLEPDDTVHGALDRWARRDGFALTDTPDGKLKLYDAKKAKRHAGGLIEGSTVAEGSSTHDLSKRFSETKVRAQAPLGSGPDKLEIEDEAKDSIVGRKRVKVIVPVEEMQKKEARERAKFHRERATGKGTKAEITVKGWRDPDGRIWTPGWLVYVESEWLGIAQDMLIQDAAYEQDERSAGTRTRLGLVDPRTWKGKSGKGNKSSGAYAAEAEED